jgi:hypothetical protein
VPIEVTLPATGPSVGDTIEIAKIPPGVQLIGYTLISPQIDSNGTPTFVVSAGTLNAGKTDLGTVYESGLTPGRTSSGNVIRNSNSASYFDDRTVERNFGLKVTAVAATYVPSKVMLVQLHLKN